MKAEVAAQLLALNRAFYETLAGSFAQSRAHPQPGFSRLLAFLPRPAVRLLDVGCGHGRLGHFFQAQGVLADYVGVDFSATLLAQAGTLVPGKLVQRDFSQPGCLDDLGQFDIVACLSAMQHLPGRENRVRLLQAMKARLAADGRIFLANWQFTDNLRQRRKIVPWEQIGMHAADVEPGDYLLTWQRDGFGLRYVCLIDASETAAMAQEVGLRVWRQFRSDGKEGDLNLYTILTIS